MQKINFQNLPSTATPINATNLNAIQSNVEDVFNGNELAGDMVVTGIRTKNLIDKSTLISNDIIGQFPTIRLSTRQVIWLEPGTYTCSCNNLTGNYKYGIQVQDTGVPPLNSYPTYVYDSSWHTTSFTFTLSTGGYAILMVAKGNNETLTPNDVKNFNFQLEKGSTATSYSPYQNINNDNTMDISQIDLINVNSGFTINHFNVAKIGKQILGTIVVSSTSDISTSNVTPFTFRNYSPKAAQFTFCGLGTGDYKVNTIGYFYLSPSGVVLVNQTGTSGMKTAVLNINYTTS